MAETSTAGGHPDMDYPEHEATYALFLRMLKFGVVGIIIILVVLAFLWG